MNWKGWGEKYGEKYGVYGGWPAQYCGVRGRMKTHDIILQTNSVHCHVHCMCHESLSTTPRPF